MYEVCVYERYLFIFFNVDRSMWVNVLLLSLLLHTYIYISEFRICLFSSKMGEQMIEKSVTDFHTGLRILSLVACYYSVSRQWSLLHARSAYYCGQVGSHVQQGSKSVGPFLVPFKFFLIISLYSH